MYQHQNMASASNPVLHCLIGKLQQHFTEMSSSPLGSVKDCKAPSGSQEGVTLKRTNSEASLFLCGLPQVPS